MKHEVKRPCADCYRLVRATFENSVGKMLIRHLKDYGVETRKINKILMRHLKRHDPDETIEERHLSCDGCGAAFIMSPSRSGGQAIFWVGWRASE